MQSQGRRELPQKGRARPATPEQAVQFGLAYVGRPSQSPKVQLSALRQPLQQHTEALTLSHPSRVTL